MESNSASRLLNVLDQLKAANTSESTAKVIKKIFNDDEESRVGVHIGQIFTLANTVHKQVLALPDFDSEVDLQWVGGVYTGLSTLSVKGNINNFRDAYKPEVRAYLHSVARNLAQHYPDPQINSDTLKEIYDDISPLIDSLLHDENIDKSLKNFILDKLLLIQDVIANAHVVGFSELSSNVESVFAGTIFRAGGVDNVQKLKKNSKSFVTFVDWLSRVLTVLEAAAPQSMSVERFFDRDDPDKQFLLSVIDSCDDPEAVMENYRRGLALINSREHYDEYANSGFFTVVREDNDEDTREEVCDRIAKHFGLA